MIKKDYLMLAKVVNKGYSRVSTLESIDSQKAAYMTVTFMLYELAEALGKDNPRFDATKFEAACRGGV